MKKLFLVSGILLLAAGCGNSNIPMIGQSNSNFSQNNHSISYCTDEEVSENGAILYPVHPKYGNLNFLGRLFTANDCSEVRLKEVMRTDDYELGSTVWLKSNPSNEFIKVLSAIGYVCSERIAQNSCKKWRLEKTVKIEEILRLLPYVELIENDDCIYCG